MFKVLGIGCGVLLLTGCGNSGKVLTCTLDSETGSAKAQMTFNEEGTELQSLAITEDAEVSESFLNGAEDLSSDEICEELDLSLITCNANINGNRIHVEATVAPKEIDQLFRGIDDDVTYDSIKEAALDDGFTCN